MLLKDSVDPFWIKGLRCRLAVCCRPDASSKPVRGDSRVGGRGVRGFGKAAEAALQLAILEEERLDQRRGVDARLDPRA